MGNCKHHGAQAVGVHHLPAVQFPKGPLQAEPESSGSTASEDHHHRLGPKAAGVWLVGHCKTHQLPGRLAHGVRAPAFTLNGRIVHTIELCRRAVLVHMIRQRPL